MVARFAGASLGLFAFAVTIAAGIYAHNPPSLILSRAIFSLFVFLGLGLLIGRAAQGVIAEHERARRADIEQRFRRTGPGPDTMDGASGSVDSKDGSMGARA